MAREAGAVRWTDPGLLILGALAGGPLHGYAIVGDVEATVGVRLGPGTLYAALARLEERGLVRALPGDERRRPYEITAAGSAVLADQIASMARFARVGRSRLQARSTGGA
jgi:DNA-binding PadR family transcriptional regulator